ncbi:hypothetical protein PHJA_003011800, partial [Phtheirospermum japonicum]
VKISVQNGNLPIPFMNFGIPKSRYNTATHTIHFLIFFLIFSPLSFPPVRPIPVMSLTANLASPITSLTIVRSEDWCSKQQKNVLSRPVGEKPFHLQLHASERKYFMNHIFRVKHASVICTSTLNATCAAEQTQTVTRQSSTITVAPIQGKEKSPDLDDGGAGFPPRDDGDGGGG